MSDIAKWALLVAGAVALIALIVALPFMQGINVSEFTSSITSIVTVAGSSFNVARRIINQFLTPVGRNILSGLLVYLFAKFLITMGIKIATWIYHFIFK